MALTSQDAMQKAIALYSGARLNPRDFKDSVWLNSAASQVSKGQIDVSGLSSCGQAPPLNLFQSRSGLALGTTAAGVGILGSAHLIAAAAIPVVGAVIAGVSVLVSIIGAIFAHHAAAVKRDYSFACSAVPAVNNAFQVVNQALASGQTTPEAASAALDEIYSQFMSAGGASSPTSIPDSGTAINKSPFCNSNCETSVILKAMVLYWQSQYADIRPSLQFASTPAGYSLTPSTAVLSSAQAAANGSPTLAQTIAPRAGYGPLLAVAAIVLVVLFVHFPGGVK
jgi:hypothetical protein